ncbi:hypothetical protein OAJ94_04320 [Deltaproteobacteria bacterium]|nr:hypothetical protein [Deltaproteobacteria bacterium]
MTEPTFSPDGQWMWDGNGWIPAPPPSNVLPQSSINPQEVTSVANQTGVDPNQLTQAAPYFDQNQDGVLQQSELQQAAMAISQSPTAPVPVQTPQQPAMQQPAMQQPAMQQPALQQPAIQQPAMQQPAMQQPAMQQPSLNQQSQSKLDSILSFIPGSNPKTKKKIVASGIAAIVLVTVIITWVNAQQLAEDESIGLHTISVDYTSNDLDSNAVGASDGAWDILGAFSHAVASSGIDWSTFEVGIYVDGDTYDCATEKDEYADQNAAKCKISWLSTIPSYSPYDPYYDGGTIDITESSAVASRCDGDPFCGDTIYLRENGYDIINSENYEMKSIMLNIAYSGGPSVEDANNIMSYNIGILDHDGDGVDDYTDDCDNTPSDDDVDGVGCTLVPDADNDGVNDDQDLLPNGNAGLKIYISQLAAVDMESYEGDQRWPCAWDDGDGLEFDSVPYSWLEDGEEECNDGSDENNPANKYPDWAYRLRVDWNCDEIYDEIIDMRNNSAYFPNLQGMNITLNSATNNNHVLSKDIAENLEKVCITVAVYDYDIVAQTYGKYDVYSDTGDTFTLNVTLIQAKSSGEFSYSQNGNNDDDASYDVPDAGVTVRFLIYDVTD